MAVFDIRSGKTELVLSFFEVTELLGTGRYSEVYRAYNHYHKTDVALKAYVGTDETTDNIAKDEDAILSKLAELNADYFPKPRGIKLHKRHPVIVMELGEYIGDDGDSRIISLKDILPNVNTSKSPAESVPEFWEKEICSEFILDLINSVLLLHKVDVIHRDVKPANILLRRSPGEQRVRPFLLDFNTSVRSGDGVCVGGTECYLPPEVVSGKRKEARFADDLWALASTIWEVVFGINQKINQGLEPHALLKFKPTSKIIDILLSALSVEPTSRFPDAEQFKSAMEQELMLKVPPAQQELLLKPDEIIWAQENKNKIFEDVIETLCGEDEIAVAKETTDKVAFVYSILTSGEVSSSFDLTSEIGNLGVKAIPSMIEKSYKISPRSDLFKHVVQGLYTLAERDMDLAKRSIDFYCISSDYTVRKMCLALCEKLEYFPTRLIESVLEDSALYPPEERVHIADICIKYSIDSSVLLTLNKYMCREYIMDPQNYHNLRSIVAARVQELNFDQKARLIIEDTECRIWEELREYESLDDSVKDDYDKGLIQLLADAFASLGEEAFNMVKEGLPSKCSAGKLKIASLFIGKLALQYPPARTWLFDMLNRFPANFDFYGAAIKLKKSLSDKERRVFDFSGKTLNVTPEPEDVRDVFDRYLSTGNRKDLRFLRWDKPLETLTLVEEAMKAMNDKTCLLNILLLMKAYKNNHRNRITKIICDYGKKFLNANLNETIYVLTEYEVPDERTRNRCIDMLEEGLRKSWDHLARKGIEKILKHQD